MATLLYRLGHFATRRRWAVLIVWLALLIGLGGAAAAFSGTMTSSFSIPGTKAQAALDQLGEKIPGAGDASGRIVFAAPAGKTLAEPDYQQAIATVVAQAEDLPGVTRVIDPATGQTVSPDQRVAFAQASFAGSGHRGPGGDPDGAGRYRCRQRGRRPADRARRRRGGTGARPSARRRASVSSSRWSCC